MKVDLWRGHTEPDFAQGDCITVFFNDLRGWYEGTFQDAAGKFFGDFTAESSAEIDAYVTAHNGKMDWGGIMERKAWTARGVMLEADKAVIQAMVEQNRVASRIFVTGEVAESYIGEDAVRLLVNANDIYYGNGAGCEPLFVETKQDTVRMRRFDPAVVWRCFHPDILLELVAEEASRLGVDMDPRALDHMDFYESMIDTLKARFGDAGLFVPGLSTMEGFYQSVYLSCLLLFDKPGYMDVPVAEHFAQIPSEAYLQGAEMYQLNDAAREKLAGLRKAYGDIEALTNQEVAFIVDLYEGAMR
jgi:hypothetical protein